MDLFFRLERTDITFIADRIFFSEMVFSRLYKQYDFARHYMQFSHDIASLNDVEIFFFTVGEADLTDRLKRNKMEFFGVEDNVKEIMKQQREYTNMFAQFVTDYPQVKFHLINTSGWD
jgi:deoxyguanosine kinase